MDGKYLENAPESEADQPECTENRRESAVERPGCTEDREEVRPEITADQVEVQTDTEADNEPEKQNVEKPVDRISVRKLVEFVLRSGDLDAAAMKGTDVEAAMRGARLHRKIQNSQSGDYAAEVSLKEDVEYDELIIRIEGRADGIFHVKARNGKDAAGRRGKPTAADGTASIAEMTFIDEIKSMYLDVDLLEEPFPLHLAQAKCYAAIYAEDQGLDEIGVRITCVSLETERIRYFDETYRKEDLRKWFMDTANRYYKWAKWELDHKKARDESMQTMPFPFPYREGQKRLTGAVWHTIKEKQQLFLMAPTGVGKTMSCVFPAVRAVGSGMGERIFYMTAKNETLAAGRNAFQILDERGLDFRTVQITSKEKMCPYAKQKCNPRDCRYAKGHFDRVGDAVFDLLTTKHMIDRETLRRQAELFTVCPFELTLDVSSWCDAILCDYNYCFDPDVSLKRFFGNGTKGDYIFLVDEAHNLVDRARDMYSASITKENVLAAGRLAKSGRKRKHGDQNQPEDPTDLEKMLFKTAEEDASEPAFAGSAPSNGGAPRVAKACERVNRLLLAEKRVHEAEADVSAAGETARVMKLSEINEINAAMFSLYGELQNLYQKSEDAALKEALLDFYFEVRGYVNTADYLDDHYSVYAMFDSENHFVLKLFCVNPAERLQSCFDRGRAAVLFSATFLPIDYYKKLLSTKEDALAVYAESPFDPSNRLLLLGRDVATRYRDRTESMYLMIAAYIAAVVKERTGNYMIFFPSYKMMRDVFECYRREFDRRGVNWVVQSPGMQEDDREIFLENFFEHPKESLLAFCVMGGIFAEGIDLTGTRLIGAIVVGVGIPQVSAEREIIKKHFDENANGFDYAYRYPGMNKVEQAAGRVIRTDLDRGVIVLLDNRFLNYDTRRLFPREWKDASPCDLGSVGKKLKEFWNDEE